MKKYLILIILLIFSVILPTDTTAQGVGGTYRFPLRFTVKTLDPAFVTDSSSVTVVQQIYDGLVQYDKNLNVVPAIAQSWEVSRDGLTYIFYIRKGVKFHNGREVTAEDFVYSFKRILSPEINSPAAPLFSKIKGASDFREGGSKDIEGLTAVDRYILRIVLKEPFAPFLPILAMHNAKVVPREEIEKAGGDFSKNPVGAGAFRFVSWTPGKEIIIEANNDYYEGRPFLDKVVYKIYPGAQTEIILKDLFKGNVENSRIPSEKREKVIKNNTRYNLVRRPLLSLYFYGLNNLKTPLSDKRIRLAINHAIDRDKYLSEITKERYYKAVSILPLGMQGHDPTAKGYEYSVETARELMKEAKVKRPIRLTILSTSKSSEAVRDLDFIKESLARIGFEVNIEFVLDWDKFEQRLRNGQFDIFRYVWYADYPHPDNFLNTLFNSSSEYNFMGYKNEEVDALIEKANAEQDYLKRMNLYRKIDGKIMDDAPVVPIYYEILEELFRPYVKGIEITGLGRQFMPMKKIWFKQ